jgi:hypothetical protein
MDQYTCKLCNSIHLSWKGLGTHIFKKHKISTKLYYDSFIVKPSSGICVTCGNQTNFRNLSFGYNLNCGYKCSRLLLNSKKSREKAKNTILKKYGVEFASQNKIISDKISKSQIDRFKNPLERIKTSITTKKAMQRESVRKNLLIAVRREKSKETLKKHSDRMKSRFLNDPNIYEKFYNKDRNLKVSIAKKKYWKENPDKKKLIGNLWKLVKQRDEKKWRDNLLKASKKAFEVTRNGDTKLETRMYEFMNLNNIKYIKQYELDYKLYDAYLIDYNILLEFDGLFWHKSTLDECLYQHQKNAYYNDIVKDGIAKKYNIPLYRIKENESADKILDIITSIKKST